MIKYYGYVISLFLMVSLFSCRKSDDVCRAFFGKEMFIPNEIEMLLSECNDTVFIVSCIDTSGCMPCRLRMNEWNRFLSHTKNNYGLDLPLFFVVNTKDESYKKRICEIVKNAHVVLDSTGMFARLNNIPRNDLLSTFLLSRNGSCLALGNPVINTNLQPIYVKSIFGSLDDCAENNSQDLIVCSSIDLGSFSGDIFNM